jgi:peroxiredoxin
MNRQPLARRASAFLRTAALLGLGCACSFAARAEKVAWSPQEQPLAERIEQLRGLDDKVRGAATQDLALRIRELPGRPNKLRLAVELASLSTEGDFGRAPLEAVAATLAQALQEKSAPWKEPPSGDAGGFDAALMPAYGYQALAQLARYEEVHVPLEGDAHFRSALAALDAEDRKRDHPDFTLKDLSGHVWRIAELRGKVVLVNFWATWCPPCRKEIPALESLAARFAAQGLVVLGISDEDAAKVSKFVRRQGISYPVLLDPGRAVNRSFAIHAIPKTFVYDRDGKLVAEAIDMRTERQFVAMLAKAGLR